MKIVQPVTLRIRRQHPRRRPRSLAPGPAPIQHCDPPNSTLAQRTGYREAYRARANDQCVQTQFFLPLSQLRRKFYNHYKVPLVETMKHTITLIPGDGIGPEIVAATVRIIEASGVDVEWETQILGAQALEKFG